MFGTDAWDAHVKARPLAKRTELQRLRNVVFDDDTFLKNLDAILKVMKPVVVLQRTADRDAYHAADLFGDFQALRQKLDGPLCRNSASLTTKFCDQLVKRFDERWEYHHNVVHSVAYLLNPKMHHNVRPLPAGENAEAVRKEKKQLEQDFEAVVELEFGKSNHQQLFDAQSELKAFREHNFEGKQLAAMKSVAQGKTTPQEWWSQYGFLVTKGKRGKMLKKELPILTTLAARFLGATVTATTSERAWKHAASIHTETRNRLHEDRLKKLTFLYYNKNNFALTRTQKMIENSV